MIGCIMFLPLAALLMAGNVVMASMIAAFGVLVVAMGMITTSLTLFSTAFLTFWIILFS